MRDVDAASMRELDAVAALDRANSPVLRSADRYRHLIRDGGVVLGIALTGEIVGFAALSVVLDEATLLNIVVDGSARRRGYGQRLLQAVLARSRKMGARRILLEAREGNRAALALYRSVGFRRDAVRRGYYPARGQAPAEAAVLMSLDLGAGFARSGNG